MLIFFVSSADLHVSATTCIKRLCAMMKEQFAVNRVEHNGMRGK